MKKIIVTGGLGYIGSHTAVELAARGFTPILVDNLANSEAGVLDGLERITGIRFTWENLDLSKRDHVAQLFERHPDASGIIHFAAYKAVGESVAEPLKYYDNNLTSLIFLLQQVAKNPIPFIFSSSCTVYGETNQLPITEDAPVVPAFSPYGNTKQIGEEILRDSCKAYPLQVISLRYFNPIGAHPSAEIGELPLGVPLNLVPYVTQTAAGVRSLLSVYGSDYPTRDGTCIRDYIHVVDLARAHVLAVERLFTQGKAHHMEVFNLGTGTGSTVLEVIHSFEKVSGQKLPYQLVDRRPGDVTAAYADTQKAEKVLGWKAEKTLDDAMADAWRWEKKVRKLTN